MSDETEVKTNEATEEKQDKAPEDAPSQSFDQRTINAFFNANIGPDDIWGLRNAAMRRLLAPATGSVRQEDIATLRHFVEPKGFTEAMTRLAHDRVVVLCGDTGIGKHSSALSLLRGVTDEILYMLSPQVQLAELAEREYEAGCGYLVIDRLVERDITESDFDWRLVRDRLAEQNAYLVITTLAAQATATESIAHIPWHPPNAERVLRACWPADWPEEHDETLRDVLGTADRVADVVELARRLSGGESPDVAVTHFGARVREQVDQWFAATTDRQKILEVAVVAFTLGVDERQFERALAMLRRAWHERMPEPERDEATAAEEDMRLRGKRAENPLVITTTVPTELGTRGALAFAGPGYHRHVLAELWRLMDVTFWDAIRDWLDVIVLQPQYEQRLAIGLAELANAALGEVLPTLDRWARGLRGTAGQRAAVYTLWLMAYEGSLAPTALQITTKWITRGQPTHRWVAAMTFSGHLGVRYPHEAVNRLWQLCVQSHTADGDVETVFGELFSTLVRETKDAGIVLTVLAGKIERFTRPGAKPHMGAVAVRTALAALAAKDPLTKRVAVLTYLAEFPDRTDLVAGLLAKVLVHRPVRLRAIRALRAVLEDLAKNDEQPEERARALGVALANRLAPDERAALETDFRSVVARKDKDIAPLVAALLKALSILSV